MCSVKQVDKAHSGDAGICVENFWILRIAKTCWFFSEIFEYNLKEKKKHIFRFFCKKYQQIDQRVYKTEMTKFFFVVVVLFFCWFFFFVVSFFLQSCNGRKGCS